MIKADTSSDLNNSPNDSINRPQFSLRSLLLIMTGVAVYIAAVLVLDPWATLEFIWFDGATGVYAIACLIFLMLGLALMIVNIVRADKGRGWEIALLLWGIFYAATNVIGFIVTLSIDPYFIFKSIYVVTIFFGAPALVIGICISLLHSYKKLNWQGATGLIVWILSVAFAHYWVVVQCARSV